MSKFLFVCLGYCFVVVLSILSFRCGFVLILDLFVGECTDNVHYCIFYGNTS